MNPEFLNTRRQVAAKSFREFRKMANTLLEKGVLKYDRDRHEYFLPTHGRNWRFDKAAKLALKLQDQLKQQAVLLVELEASNL